MPDSKTQDLLYIVEGNVGLITLNRPHARNALTFEMYARIAEICTSIPADGPVRVIVVTGAGEKAFAAGTDISLFRNFDGASDGLAYEARMSEVIGRIESCPVPMIAAISGACTGGGAAIAACCDLRVGTRDMKFGFPIARTLGNCLSSGSLSKLVFLIGPAKTTDLIFTSRLMGAEEAHGIGLISEILPDHAALMARARALAGEIAGYAPLTLRVTKEMLARMRRAQPKIEDKDLIALCYGSQDFREGLEAFLAKRRPQWQGR
ncbi:MAG: enoyl-CoA hydratase/isomerase family protein [Hyphomicrobiaceae bacterium]|jgi:enoyl-CoA hydratase/carnithine racemase